MAVSWDKFVPDIIREVPKCPKILIIDTIKDVIREVCEDTKIWQNEDAISFVLPANQNYFDVSSLIPDGSEIDAIVWIKQDPSSYYDLSNYMSYYLDNDNIIRFTTINGRDLTLYARFSFKPTLDATTIPDLFYNRCRFAIKHGVLFTLMSQTNTDWFNANGAVFHQSQYFRFLAQIKRNLWKGRTRQRIYVSAPRRFDV